MDNRCEGTKVQPTFYVVNTGAKNVVYGEGKTKADYTEMIQK